jgi:hypothetical protein
VLPVQPRITAHVGALVIRSKLESRFETFVKIARLAQLIIGLAR